MLEVDAELVNEFVVESQEGLANIERQLLEIEAAGANIDVDLVNAVFRTMHSIKGTAGFLGLDRIGTLAHCLEDVLNRMRNREIVPTSALVSTALEAADFMKGLIDAVESSNTADINPYLNNLQPYRTNTETPKVLAAPVAVPVPPTPAASDVTTATENEDISEAVREFVIECFENLDVMERDLVSLEHTPNTPELLRSIFRTMHTIKGGAGFLGLRALEQLAHTAENLLGKVRDGAMELSHERAGVLLATIDKCRQGIQLLEKTGSDTGFAPEALIQQLLTVGAGEQAQTVTAKPTVVNSPVVQPVAPAVALPAVVPVVEANQPTNNDTHNANKNAVSAGDSTIRVDVALLDKLMTRVGELVLARNQILQHTNGLEDAEFVSTAQRLNLITTELQEGVMKTRMQPIGNVWSKFPRVVRDLSSQLKKQVRIEIEGKETELDKTIIEAIKDPLTHLVRNSVDHGIETPEVRRAAGKPEEGCLLLRAYHEGGQVNIEITDDGAGLNIERIRRKAIEKGLISAEQAARMTEREAAQLILLPGFSTAEQITSVSGRGVGMDVVKTNIEKIGGTLDLQSRFGHGTTVKIKIPLTLAIIPALIVTSSGDRYAIPQVNLLELVRLEGDQVKRGIEYVHGTPVYRLRGKLLPLVYLSERLGLSEEAALENSEDKVINIVVLRANDRQFGLVVDKVNDTEEIVVKPLNRQLKGLSEYAGAMIMGDGSVALILDVFGLAVASGLTAEIRDNAHAGFGREGKQNGTDVKTLLVVDLGDARRFALPTGMVARLEKVQLTDIELADGHEVIQYRDSILPLVRLSDVFNVHTNVEEQPDHFQIIVYSEENYSCGFVVNRIIDIVETELRLHVQKNNDDKLIGTAVIQERVTDVLNLRTLARSTEYQYGNC
jgi:two-component system, chemotaxis family, sensor kinase CheA